MNAKAESHGSRNAQNAPDIRSKSGARYPLGPSSLSRLLTGKHFQQTPLQFLQENAVRYGDLVHLRTLEGHAYQINHPALIAEMFVDNERRNRRVRTMQRARAVLGDGLLTSEEPLHMRQRRMAAPAFHRQRIAAYGEVLGRYAAEITGQWEAGTVDLHPQMLLLALRIVGKCLFDINEVEEARRIAAAVAAFMVPPPPGWVPVKVIEHLQRLPLSPIRKVRQGIEDLDRILYGMIAERRREPGDRGDLLSMLIDATDTEASSATEDAQMSDKQIRDECLTVLLAGHETTANALSFALWFLARHPEVQERGHREAMEVLDTRQADASDYAALKYTYNIFAEAMRLLPTVWVLGRSCGPEPYQFHGFTIEPGATLLAPQIVVHRDPRFWDEPERFNPDRFSESKSSRPKFAYFPFGGGSRQCIGESLAWMEGVLVLATILRDWKLEPTPGAPEALPILPSINLRPKNGVPLVLARR